MTYLLRRFAAVLFATFAFTLPASATTFSTDYTDLWFNPAESGWGVNVIQQGNTIFATLFVYGPDQAPTWYVASNTVGASATSFTGPLYRTTGPYFGAVWTGGGPAIQVGTMTFNFTTPTTATLTYSVNGVTVTKSVQRQSFVFNNLGGNYVGGVTGNASGCTLTGIFAYYLLTVTHAASNAISLRVDFFAGNGAAANCTFNGTYSQNGKLGNVAGNWSCSTSNAGAFTISEITSSITGWSGRFSGNDQSCRYTGYFGGTRDVVVP